jgi:hypothetical protein
MPYIYWRGGRRGSFPCDYEAKRSPHVSAAELLDPNGQPQYIEGKLDNEYTL